MSQSGLMPNHVEVEDAIAALPDEIRELLEPLGRPGALIACDLYNLRHIKTKGTYLDGTHDGALLAMALAGIGAARVYESITDQQWKVLQAYALKEGKVEVPAS